MAHLTGKFVLNSLVNTRVVEVEYDDEIKRGIFIPFKDNDISYYAEADEWQLWFRAFRYREPKTRFTHFLMKWVPNWKIKQLSQEQIERFATHSLGKMIKSKYEEEPERDKQPTDL